MSHIEQGFNNALRRQAAREKGSVLSSPLLPRLQTDVLSSRTRASQGPQEPSDTPREPEVHTADPELPPPKRLKSPANSDGDRGGQRNRTDHGETTSDFLSRPPTKGKKLWNAGEPPLPRSAAAQQASSQPQQRSIQQNTRQKRNQQNRTSGTKNTEEEDPSVTVMIKQPETRPISQEQLIAEVKGIYAGLVMVETKCIEVDSAQNAQGDSAAKLNNEQWQALIALHRTLLHEHHDFLLASQHPSANPALRRLASKYAMPARMWRHGIHSFLELLRHRLPASLEHMKTFINSAYSMMALLFETVPAFEVSCVVIFTPETRISSGESSDFQSTGHLDRVSWRSRSLPDGYRRRKCAGPRHMGNSFSTVVLEGQR